MVDVLERPSISEQPAKPSDGKANLVLETDKSKRDQQLGRAIERLVAAGRYPDREKGRSSYAYRVSQIKDRNHTHGIPEEITNDQILEIQNLSRHRENRGQLILAIRDLIDFQIGSQKNEEGEANVPGK